MKQMIRCRPRMATALLCAAFLSACGGGDGAAPEPDRLPPIAEAPSGRIAGQVLSASDGSPLAGVRVSAAGQSAISAADGRFSLAKVAVGAAVMLRFEAPQHADSYQSVEVRADRSSLVQAHLVPAGAEQALAIAQGGMVSLPGSVAAVSLPANSLVLDGSSTAASGEVRVRITAIDPAQQPASMPGNYRISGGGLMESFGAIKVDLRDAAGQRLNLKAGSSATIRIPVATRSPDLPASIPLFYLDEKTGLWVQQGNANLAGPAQSPYYEGTVSHFTFWNADKVQDSIFVHGCLVDEQGRPLSHLPVSSTGLDYSGMDQVLSDGQGKFKVAIRKQGRAGIHAEGEGLGSDTVKVGPSETDIVLSECLVLKGGMTLPQFVSQPEVGSVYEGYPALITALVSGRELRYQWLRNGVELPGEQAPALSLLPSLADQGARYQLRASNPAGSVLSQELALHVAAASAPAVLVQPLGRQAVPGEAVSFEVEAAGAPVLQYQWQRNGVDIAANAQGERYVTPALSLADHGARYRVRISNRFGSVFSQEVLLSVVQPVGMAPRISAQPQSGLVLAGQRQLLSVVAEAEPAPSYQWLRNGQLIAGANAAVYQTPALSLADSGVQYSVRVSNALGAVDSAAATLTVTESAGAEADKLALLRLIGAGFGYLEAALVPMQIFDEDGRILAGSAVCQSGTVDARVNGAPAQAGQMAPLSASVSTVMNACRDADGTVYNGRAELVYTLSSLEPLNGSAAVTLSGLRVSDASGTTVQSDVSADGSAQARLEGSDANGQRSQSFVFAFGSGATLRNELSGQVARFGGGELVLRSLSRLSDDELLQSELEYRSLGFSVGDTAYNANGRLSYRLPAAGQAFSVSGEIVLSSAGATVGRIFANADGVFIEVAGVVRPFVAAPHRAR